jgi:FixJ family two-component response regulator
MKYCAGKVVDETVYVVDDDEALRDSLKWLLEAHGHGVSLHGCAEDFLDVMVPDMAGCLLLDVRMPGMSGLELHDILLARGFRLPVVFITGHGDVPMAVLAVKKGAADFIEKPFNDQAILGLVADCLARDAARRQAEVSGESDALRLASLTPREREVLDKVVAGKLNKIIADEMAISIKTVEAHRAKVMEKMGARSIAELVQRVVGKK